MQSQYDAGFVKIWSGEPGHRMAVLNYGQDKNFFPDPGFADVDLFNPLTFIESQSDSSPLWSSLFTFPIITGDNDQLENFNFNGIIEPLSIRPVASFFSIDVPFEAHSVKGLFGSGNDDNLNGSDDVVSVYDFEPNRQIVGYLDMVDIVNPGSLMSGTWSSGSIHGSYLSGSYSSGSIILGVYVPTGSFTPSEFVNAFTGSGVFTPVFIPTGTPLNGFFQNELTSLSPFVDAKLVRNVIDPTAGKATNVDNDWQLTAALSYMTGSTDNYIRYNQVSMPCGWYYDNNASVGTDSITYGGMTY